MTLALSIGILVAGGVYLVLQRGMVRMVLGFILLSHAVNLLLVSSGGAFRREAPLTQTADVATAADPLPQAFTLTAIVIAFGITIYMLTLAVVRRDDDADAPPPAGKRPARSTPRPATPTTEEEQR